MSCYNLKFNLYDNAYYFGNGSNLYVALAIGKSLETVGENALANCSSLTGIEFNGTVEKWDTIVKAETWNSATGEYTINCSDGTISKDGTVTKTE